MSGLDVGNPVANNRGERGRVSETSHEMAKVEWEADREPGWFSRYGDKRLTVVADDD